jgi:hypothetical protein
MAKYLNEPKMKERIGGNAKSPEHFSSMLFAIASILFMFALNL